MDFSQVSLIIVIMFQTAYHINNPIGCILFTFTSTETNRRNLFLSHFSILPQYRRYGYGRCLFESALEYSRYNRDTIESISLEVNINNPVVMKMYRKYGFTVTGMAKENTRFVMTVKNC